MSLWLLLLHCFRTTYNFIEENRTIYKGISNTEVAFSSIDESLLFSCRDNCEFH